jgi:eukaryotic-like serine/threonine-protein kinase
MNPAPFDADRTPVWHSVAATDADVVDLAPGTGIARYRLERVLGEGTYGQVHLARQDVLGRKVAVKILHRRHGSKRDEIRAFANEALILADLNHPGIVPVYDAGWTDDGFFYIVSRFVEGGDLSTFLTKGRHSPEQSARLVMAIAEALGYAHSRGLVHRDIKPANVLIDLPQKPLLTDFGVALRDIDFGRGSGLVGTPAYMSPEQARGEGNRVDGRSDIFSLGIVFYELLTGLRPFCSESQRELLDQVIRADLQPPGEIDSNIPETLGQICQRALAKRPSDRYATAEEMAAELGDWLRGASTDHILKGFALSRGKLADSPLMLSTRGSHQTPTIRDQTGGGPHELTIHPRGLLPYEANDASFFLDMLPGPRDASGLPNCIEFWKSRIDGKRGDECFRVGLLFGPSGCGKTSLIRAGLLPALSERVSVIHIEATADGTEAALLGQMQVSCTDLSKGVGLASAFIAARKGLALGPGQKVLVVIDQFEHWLRCGRDDDDQGLLAALRQCDGEHVQAIAVVQDDTWTHASRFMRELGDRIIEGVNSAAVDPFDRRHARKILAALGRAYGTLPEGSASLSEDQESFLDRAISALDAGHQILPARLALFAEVVKRRAWLPQTLDAFGAIDAVTTAFAAEIFHPGAAPPETTSAQPTLVNVNTASEQELKSLPGVGAAIARRIIGGRPYRNVDGLLEIKGIGKKNLEEMRSLIEVE